MAALGVVGGSPLHLDPATFSQPVAALGGKILYIQAGMMMIMMMMMVLVVMIIYDHDYDCDYC